MNMRDQTALAEVGTTGHVIDPKGINHPKHYNNHPSGIEVKLVTNFMVFNLGSAFKYVLRRGEKLEPGLTPEQMVRKDLQKALWYLREQTTLPLPPLALFSDSAEQSLKTMMAHEPNRHVQHFMNHVRRFCTSGMDGALNAMIHSVSALHDEVPLP